MVNHNHTLHSCHDSVLIGLQVNAKCHILVAVCVVMTYT